MNKLPMMARFEFKKPRKKGIRGAVAEIKKLPEKYGLHDYSGTALKDGEVLTGSAMTTVFMEYLDEVLTEIGLGRCVMNHDQEAILKFMTVPLHMDEMFCKFTVLLPLVGRGMLYVTDGKDISSGLLQAGIGCVFNNHLPHTFILESKVPMIALSGNFDDDSRRTKNTVASWLIDRAENKPLPS